MFEKFLRYHNEPQHSSIKVQVYESKATLPRYRQKQYSHSIE